MAETILFGIAEEVLKNLGSNALNEIASAWGFKTQLKELKNTINTLKDVLLDAEGKQADDLAVRGWLERLSTVVYAADDLFDEFATVAARKEIMGGCKLTKEVRTFFSHSNQVASACKISRKIKKIREELDGIERDAKQFEFVRNSTERRIVIDRRRDPTVSKLDEDEVVGRDDEKKAILDMLLASSSTGHENGHEGLHVIPIVGMGGMGKTTLAQLIYNDSQVEEHFDLRLWVCVSDVFDIKSIIDKLLKSATNKETPNLEMDQLQRLLHKEVADKKYLLVLDDVWNEERQKWLNLRNHLNIGRHGSKILVTTRSWEVANIMGTYPAYDLQGLSEEKSWKLFEKMAFKNPEEAKQKSHLVEIGKEIVKKCGRVPLAIRTLGCLLYGQGEEREWLSIKDKSLAKITGNQNYIMDILKLSYHHLCSPLKNCFAYCALFPKDFEFDKEMLKDLWIADHDKETLTLSLSLLCFVPDADEYQTDHVAELYLHKLVERGFLQDIQSDELGVSCKMHDLMHDLAQEVSGVKSKVAKSDERYFDERSVHLSLAFQLTSTWEIPKSMLNMKLLRTFLLPEQINNGSLSSKSISHELLMRFKSLRVLDLHNLSLKSLPSSIGKLVHLRYLNLSETPANMRKLTNLRCLDVEYCSKLSHMPSGLGGLTSLNSLPQFIVGTAADERYKSSTAKLSDLKNLNNLRGSLWIKLKGKLEKAMLEAREAKLSSKHGLTKLMISLPDDESDCNDDEVVLEGLKPPSYIKRLWIHNYRGENVPSWARMYNLCTTLPYLVQIFLWRWKRCQQLPGFSQLRFLKRLTLINLESVEYIESHDVGGVPSSSIFFPSLEDLELSGMKNLKGWWKEEDAIVNENDTPESASNESARQIIPTTFIQFSKLSKLYISDCPNLRMLPLCPNVEDLTLLRTNDCLSVLKMATSSSSSSIPSSSSTGTGLKLKELAIDNMEELMSLPNHCLQHLSSLRIDSEWGNKLESTEILQDVFASLSSSLRSLMFCNCHELRSIGKGLEHLTALETLKFLDCANLDEWGDEEGMPWKALNTTLRSLTLGYLPQLVGLPRGLQHLSNLRSLYLLFNPELEELPECMNCLSSLESLELCNCPKLTSLPEAFCQLTNLNRLEIIGCPRLKARCQSPNGIDWPKIKHIPLLHARDNIKSMV